VTVGLAIAFIGLGGLRDAFDHIMSRLD